MVGEEPVTLTSKNTQLLLIFTANKYFEKRNRFPNPHKHFFEYIITVECFDCFNLIMLRAMQILLK